MRDRDFEQRIRHMNAQNSDRPDLFWRFLWIFILCWLIALCILAAVS